MNVSCHHQDAASLNGRRIQPDLALRSQGMICKPCPRLLHSGLNVFIVPVFAAGSGDSARISYCMVWFGELDWEDW